MKYFQPRLFLVFFAALFLNACAPPNTNSNNSAKANKPSNTNADTTKDDTEEFAKIVKLPVQPEEVSWRESADKKIIAVLKFSATEANNLVAQIEKHKPAQNAEVNAENWFPPELVAQSQQAGDATLKGKEYAANDFFLAPYTKGKITRIDSTNYFILELSAS